MNQYQGSIDDFKNAIKLFKHATALGYKPTEGALKMNRLQGEFIEEAEKLSPDEVRLDHIMLEVGVIDMREQEKPEEERWFIQVMN